MRNILLTIAAALAALASSAAPVDSVKPLRPVAAAYTVEAGAASIVNTYLSPLKYSGWSTALSYERMQAMRANPENLVMRLASSLTLNRTDNPARNASMWRLAESFSWGMTRRWALPYGLTLAAGGSTSLDIGAVYSTRNGNNPVSPEAAWTVNLTGMAVWNGRIGRLPVNVRYQPTIPVAGIFFSPEYGELFYEISLGDRDGLVHPAWWGNYFRMENLLTADLRLGATFLRVGFRSNVISTKVNNLTTRIITTQAVIGISGEWISLRPGNKFDSKTRVISALY